MSGGTENFKIFGGKEINGNGHTVDVHEQLIGLNKYNDTESALFLFRPVDKYTPFSVVFRDLNLVGNFGYWSTERVLEVIQRDDPSFTAEQVENDLGRGFYNRFSYKAAIIIYNDYYEPDGKTQYSYAIPYIKNVNIRGFNVGMKLYYSVDEIALTGSGRPAVRDVTLSNMFGDGMTFEASTVTVENVNAGIMGGPPIALNGPDKADNAGAYRNQVAYTNLVGSINIDNPTDGTGLFLKYELSVNDGIAALFTQIKGGVATVINTVVGFLVSKVQAPYREAGDFEMVEKIASSITNILQTQNVNGVNRDMFNLVYYNASEAGVLNIEDKSQIVQMDEQFCLNGIDTTHKFIEVHFYDVLAQLPAFSSLISQYEDVLRPLMVIIANYNYVENN